LAILSDKLLLVYGLYNDYTYSWDMVYTSFHSHSFLEVKEKRHFLCFFFYLLLI